MLRALGKTPDGTRVMLLGLSEQNIQFMREGKMIFFDAEAVGFQGSIAILSGETEKDIVEQLEKEGILTVPEGTDLDPLPPVEPPDPDMPIPYVTLQKKGTQCVMVSEKGVPDRLKTHLMEFVEKKYGPLNLMSPEITEVYDTAKVDIVLELLHLKSRGHIHRMPFNSERYWLFELP